MRCCQKSSLASSSVVPTGAVTSGGLRHECVDGLVEVLVEAQVAVGEDADERWSASVIGTPEMW